jgi:DNA-binding response OmpR family regulator/nitrogen-specific signal transduction histidine kinase
MNPEQQQNDQAAYSADTERLRELDQVRSRFFANISHEFRTPLTLILAPLETLLNRVPPDSREEMLYLMMQRNARRLLNLINQVLDLARLEAGNLELHNKPGQVVELLKSLATSFAPLAENRRIDFRYELPDEEWRAFLDMDKLEKIVVNLLSNACKYTPDGGVISLQAQISPAEGREEKFQTLTLTVTDNGIGIEQDQMEKIFDRFYQADSGQSQKRESTGIGLALTKELVELYGGTIGVESKAGMGTRFTVTLPLETVKDEGNAPGAEAFYSSGSTLANAMAAGQPDVIPSLYPEPDYPSSTGEPTGEEQPVLLIVEDNLELSAFMAAAFRSQYQVLEAGNGKLGWEKALETVPDVVVSDVMMPVMDGMELSRKLKTDERTSHIPLVLLTAQADHKSRLEGLTTGADDYLTKPFHLGELQLRVRNLVEGRKRLREKFKGKPAIEPTQLAVTPADERFLKRTIAIINDHIDEADFTAEAFEKEVGLSHVQFYRKMKALTGQAPGEFLRNYRLQQAAMLLRGRHGNVTEVAYTVGFTSLAYFTRCFRALYGMSPSDYISNQDHPQLTS